MHHQKRNRTPEGQLRRRLSRALVKKMASMGGGEGVGPTGPQGPQGIQGETGAQGPAGVDGSDGATKDYAHFYLSGAGNTGLTSTEVTLTLNATGEVSNSLASIASNIITISKTGIFKIEVSVYLNNSSTARTEYSLWLEQEGVEMAGTRFASYQRGYDSGQSSSMVTIANVTSGDEFTIQCQRTDGTATAGYQDSNGTSVVITEL